MMMMMMMDDEYSGLLNLGFLLERVIMAAVMFLGGHHVYFL
jgi:hypothetical protein